MTRDFEGDFRGKDIEVAVVPVIFEDGRVSQQFWHAITKATFDRLTEWHAAVNNLGAVSDRERLNAVIAAGRMPWLSSEPKGTNISDKSSAMVAKRWADALGVFPEWAIVRAFKTYEREEHFPPKIADIIARCQRFWPQAHLADKVRSILDRVAEVKPEWAA